MIFSALRRRATCSKSKRVSNTRELPFSAQRPGESPDPQAWEDPLCRCLLARADSLLVLVAVLAVDRAKGGQVKPVLGVFYKFRKRFGSGQIEVTGSIVGT